MRSGFYSEMDSNSIFNRGKLAQIRTMDAARATVHRVESDLGEVTFAEEMFHRLFGTRGISSSELDVAAERRDLMEVQQKLVAKLGSLSGNDLVNASALNTALLRHIGTYPTNAADAEQWRVTAATLTHEAKRFIGPPLMAILFALAALGVGGLAIAKLTGRL